MPYAAFVAVALASVLTGGYAYWTGEEATRFKFTAAADDALGRIESRLDLDLSLLVTTRAFLEAKHETLSDIEFERFFDALSVDRNFPGLRGIGYLLYLRSGQNRETTGHFGNGSNNPSIYPATDQPWQAPIALFQPMGDANKKALGFDMYSDPARRQAIDEAVTTGSIRATARLQLGQAIGSPQPTPGILVFAAVRPDDDTHRSPGLAYIGFRTSELFQAALAQFPVLPVSVEIHDQGGDDQEGLLFRSAEPSSGAGLRVTRRLEVAGRNWQLSFTPTSAFEPPNSIFLPWLLGLAGMMLAVAVAVLARYQQRAYEAKSRLHETSERNLRERELMLQEMKHRIKNSIARVLAISRQTALNSSDLDAFSVSFGARLQAMAASQDLLTQSRSQKAGLRDLLLTELEQVFGKDVPESVLSGDQVELSEKAAQALGLTFHELATNALKYGEVSNSVNALRVKWRIDRRAGRNFLILHWREIGTKFVETTRKGFGTRLIEMSIVGELGGTIDRSFDQEAYTVEISIPVGEKPVRPA